jgi:hypothetical protein
MVAAIGSRITQINSTQIIPAFDPSQGFVVADADIGVALPLFSKPPVDPSPVVAGSVFLNGHTYTIEDVKRFIKEHPMALPSSPPFTFVRPVKPQGEKSVEAVRAEILTALLDQKKLYGNGAQVASPQGKATPQSQRDKTKLKAKPHVLMAEKGKTESDKFKLARLYYMSFFNKKPDPKKPNGGDNLPSVSPKDSEIKQAAELDQAITHLWSRTPVRGNYPSKRAYNVAMRDYLRVERGLVESTIKNTDTNHHMPAEARTRCLSAYNAFLKYINQELRLLRVL